jgi:hypothetical protein
MIKNKFEKNFLEKPNTPKNFRINKKLKLNSSNNLTRVILFNKKIGRTKRKYIRK